MLIAQDEIFGPVQTILKFKYVKMIKYIYIYIYVNVGLLYWLLLIMNLFITGILMKWYRELITVGMV